jgi:23S rRNA pseudouridine2605 synthase
LNQAIAKTGYCSRRHADELIAAGSVRVNGSIVRDYNMSIDPACDRLSVKGKDLSMKKYIYIVMNKPLGIVTSCADEKGRASVLTLLPEKLRFLRPVGRLDMNSKGLLILTNDGALTQRLTHPSLHEIKRYHVTVDGQISTQALRKLRSGVDLPDGKTLPAEVFVVETNPDQTLLNIGLRQGRNRQIRRMCKQVGYSVLELTRISVGGLELGKLRTGAWRYLTRDELHKLGVTL